MKYAMSSIAGIIALSCAPAFAQTTSQQQRITELENKVESLEQSLDESEGGIQFGGAARFQYSYEDYDDQTTNQSRGGDLDFELFRINVDGSVGDVLLSAEYRFYQYMHTIHHAFVGYDITPRDQIQLGITGTPFGVMPYNSHSFFFSSNYYLGLEDDYDAGLLWRRHEDRLRLDLGFFKNDEMGGVDGYVEDRTDRYSYDILGSRDGEGTFDAPATALAETNTLLGRAAFDVIAEDDRNLELGVSGQWGDIVDGDDDSAGSRYAFAIHGVLDWGPWNFQAQVTQYEFDLDSGRERIAVGAYAFYDTIASEATSYTLNAAYSMPVSIGPVTNLTFYNDFSLVTDKSADLDDTIMNVTGVAISAGGVYAYLDFVQAQNQPFIGGSMDSTDSEWNRRLNLNVGYYF